MQALGLAKHDRVLLWEWQGEGIVFWPLISMTRDAYGFCEITPAEWGLQFPSLSLGGLATLLHSVDRAHCFTRGGDDAGALVRQEPIEGPEIWPDETAADIRNYEVSTLYGSGGLNIRISGVFNSQSPAEGGVHLIAKEFSADVTIPWETLTLRGFAGAGVAWKFGNKPLPNKNDLPNRLRDPRKLRDLLVNDALTWPIVKGHISFTPEVALPSHRTQSADHFLNIIFPDPGPEAPLSDRQIGFSDAPGVEILDNGFARARGSDRWFNLETIGRSILERELQSRDALSMVWSGDAIGSVRYRTEYAEEPGDPLGSIGQRIRTISLQAALQREGLKLSAEGDLYDFDPVVIAEHREMRGSKLQPVRSYTLEAILPWALLAARGFAFADKVGDF